MRDLLLSRVVWGGKSGFGMRKCCAAVWEHGELRSSFLDEIVNKRQRFRRNFSTWLINAYALRNAAQYALKPPKVKKIRRMANHTREFIQEAEKEMTK